MIQGSSSTPLQRTVCRQRRIRECLEVGQLGQLGQLGNPGSTLVQDGSGDRRYTRCMRWLQLFLVIATACAAKPGRTDQAPAHPATPVALDAHGYLAALATGD